MSTPPANGDKVSNRQLYDELGKLRKHLYIVIACAMGLNQYLAAVNSAEPTRLESYLSAATGLIF